MKKISLAVLLCHWLTAVTAQQHYSKAVNEQIARVENNLSGGLVIDNYQIVWAKLTPNTLFEPGSISKSLNAVGILQLAQQGKLDLYQDQPVPGQLEISL